MRNRPLLCERLGSNTLQSSFAGAWTIQQGPQDLCDQFAVQVAAGVARAAPLARTECFA